MAATSFHPRQQPREREREDKLGFEGEKRVGKESGGGSGWRAAGG